MRRFVLALSLLLFTLTAARAEPQWLTLPPTPSLPQAARSGDAPVNGIKIWYAEFGAGAPVILLHGGLANANYWGKLVPALAPHYRVIVMDSRGHGRSSRDDKPYGYDLMASDVLALMDYLKIDKAALIGWSDGAIIGLDIAMHHPERLTKLFAFAANSDPTAVKDVEHDPVFSTFIARARTEYQKLSPTPNEYDAFLKQITKMGSLSGIMGMLPGMGKIKEQLAGANLDNTILKRQAAIIGSMTVKERRDPDIIKASRKKRIASGSGVTVQEVNQLLKQYEQMTTMMKRMNKMGQKGMMRGGLASLMGQMGGPGGPGGRPGGRRPF